MDDVAIQSTPIQSRKADDNDMLKNLYSTKESSEKQNTVLNNKFDVKFNEMSSNINEVKSNISEMKEQNNDQIYSNILQLTICGFQKRLHKVDMFRDTCPIIRT